MRVVSGSVKGKRLCAVKGLFIRPTSDKIRESVFNILGHTFHYKHVLDLFAGTGAMGIEALSRGAESAVFVDSNYAVIKIIRKNLDICGFSKRAKVLKIDVIQALSLKPLASNLFDLIFIDPPYEAGFTDAIIEIIDKNVMLTKDGIIVSETSKRIVSKPALSHLEEFDKRRYGDTIVTFYRNKERS
ncbi:MAG: 16S rRNA (guanine(966)-N(2))-methyltransferase RsmD [Deltaproteobacteria bacterium]|nr:16S rRNA (guanine(966)-N(2))-methyltransferase RsmD [Deltaproteobacteria bacterium]